MRIKSLSVSGFRGFGQPALFDLDADAIILVGPNGSGKTSLFDAILWALCGRVDRVSGGDSSLVSLWSETGRAEVSVTIGDQFETLKVTRVFDGETTAVTLEVDGGVLRGPSAVARLCQALWPEATETSDVVETVALALTRSSYLQQDLVTEFIEADSDDKRFEVISELFGIGRVADFQSQLDRERTAWARARKEREIEVSDARMGVATLEQRLGRLSPASDLTSVSLAWERWWELAMGRAGLDVQPRLASAGATDSLDTAMHQIREAERHVARSLREASSILQRVESSPIEATSNSLPQDDLIDLDRLIARAELDLSAAQSAASEKRRRQVAERETAEELSSLATLALRHLGGTCPVCDQDHEISRTTQRLQNLVSIAPRTSADEGDLVQISSTALSALVKRRLLHLAEVRRRDAQLSELEALGGEIDGLLLRQGLSHDAEVSKKIRLERATNEMTQEASVLRSLLSDGEDLAVAVSRSSEAAQRADLEAALSRQLVELRAIEDDLDRRNRTYDLAVGLLDGLRGATTEVVVSELKRMEPVLQQVFAMVDPHPVLRRLSLVGRFANKKGRIDAVLVDPESGESTRMPENVLSSSQRNGLAVSVFIALNLGARNLPLETVALDDPLQSLDDVNLLGVADLLRRLKEHRQIIISTHDRRFAGLLERKLRALDSDSPTIVYSFETWSRSGPVVEKTTLQAQPAKFRLVG